jgi:hypothetical protein
MKELKSPYRSLMGFLANLLYALLLYMMSVLILRMSRCFNVALLNSPVALWLPLFATGH